MGMLGITVNVVQMLELRGNYRAKITRAKETVPRCIGAAREDYFCSDYEAFC
jgi:hypothetical protein